MRPTGNCRSCDAPIVLARTAKGKMTPLDPDPVVDGNVFVVRHDADGTPTVAIALSADAVPRSTPETERYVVHFVTCPQADSWRKGRKR